jgi:BirA family biotin operon repressor/biotin-[acetyl-CoA-carboxylase] ligase
VTLHDRRADIEPAAVRAALLDPGRWDVRYVPVTGSTNADLAALAGTVDDQPADGTVLITDEQRAGRGRLGRTWHAPRGSSLMMSVLLWPTEVPLPRRGWVGALFALAIRTAIRRSCGLPAELKWPNDVLIDGRKCAGILAEVAGDAVVVGAGINVSLTADELAEAAGATGTPGTSLALAGDGRPPDRAGLAAAVLNGFAGLLDSWYAAGGEMEAAGLLPRYRAALSTVGASVRVQLPTGEAVLGTATDVAADGRLLVRDAGGMQHSFSAADVVHLRPAQAHRAGHG